jgi:DNA-binding Lrp family transcriptional regulator
MTVADERLDLAWRAAPPTVAFILRLEAASRNTRDIVDGLMFAAIQASNVSGINADPELQVAYATLMDAPPDELRRPVSVSAIAHSLRMPFETARRRVQALVRIGALTVTPKGVLVSRQALGSDMFLANVFLRHEMLRDFYFEMKRLGVPPQGPPGARLPSPALPVRLTNRLIWEYMLRVADALGVAVGDATNGVILLAMIQRNTDGFGPAQFAAWAQDPVGQGQPVRNGTLAAALNFSTETLRRHVIALEAKGFCVRGPRGLLAIEPPYARAGLERMVLDNLANLQRLFARLNQFGVCAAWERDAAPTSATA